jgi:TetR/AcrR family transcriptional regulator, regulator of mycofactocin system
VDRVLPISRRHLDLLSLNPRYCLRVGGAFGSSVTWVVESVSQAVRSRHAEQMMLELEGIALALFEERGFAVVTVEEIAAEGGISPRTFYRHFSVKEDVVQVRIDQRAKKLQIALGESSMEEPPMHALRDALVEVAQTEDDRLLRQWMTVIESSPVLIRAALGGIHLKVNAVMAHHFATRLSGQSAEDLVPTMLASAAGGVLLTVHARWFLEGGSLADRIAEAFDVLQAIVEAEAVTGRQSSIG